MASCEVIDGRLQVTGNLDKANDPEFQSALERYCSTVDSERIIDLSNVRWLNNSVAKLIIQSATDILEKGSRLRVLSSRHVQQTLNLLGAQAYLTIEVSARPAAAASSDPHDSKIVQDSKPGHDSKVSQLVGLDDADLVMPGLNTPVPGSSAAAGAGSVAPNPDESKIIPRPSIPAAPAARPTGALASPTEELTRGAILFRLLHADRRYSFIIHGQEITGVVRERIGGSWVLVETSGRRKVLNLDVVEMVEML